MNTTRLSHAFVSLALFLAAPAVAQETVEEVTSNPSNAVMAEDWGTGITDTMEEYLRESASGDQRGWRLGRHENNPSGGYIGWGRAPIQVPMSDERYGQARTAAYQAAYSNAMDEFARTMSIDIAVETINESFRDEQGASRIDPESTDSFLEALGDRVSTLSIEALNQGLERLGADPDSLPRYDRGEKHRLAQDLLTQRVATEAAARIRGVRTLATFEDGRDVGMLIIHHPRLERLADRMLTGAAASPKSGDVDAILGRVDDLSDSELVFQQGVRVIPDSEGIPVVLSFGQASPAVTKADSDRRIRMAISDSRQVAESQADGGITQFLNSTVFASSETELVSSEYQDIQQVGRQLVRSEGASVYQDVYEMIRLTARAEVSGITTIRRWQANHPDTGHLYTGVVRMWTPSQSFEYNPALGAGAGKSPEQDAEQAEGEEGDRKVRVSKDLMDGDW
jgi:hypothetical protein